MPAGEGRCGGGAGLRGQGLHQRARWVLQRLHRRPHVAAHPLHLVVHAVVLLSQAVDINL